MRKERIFFLLEYEDINSKSVIMSSSLLKLSFTKSLSNITLIEKKTRRQKLKNLHPHVHLLKFIATNIHLLNKPIVTLFYLFVG